MCVIMKYQSNLLMFGILLLLSYSCNPSRKDIGSIEVDESNDNLLVEYVDEYIDSIASEFHSEMTPIYSVYFFSKKDFTYFTIWTFTDFPSYIEDIVKDTTLKYKPCIIRDRYVIF